MSGPTIGPSQNTLLHMAVLENKEEVVKFLLKHGADANSRSSKEPLYHLGGESASSELREIFYRYRSSSFTTCTFTPNPITTRSTYTIGQLAGPRSRSQSNVSEKYKQYQQQQQLKNPTPMHVAAANGNRAIVELLLSNGGDVNAEMEAGYTPLAIAILLRHLDIVEMLLKVGANVNVRMKDGKTPMYFAVKSKQIEMVVLLLRYGGDANARTDHGVTPLHIAVERKLQEVTELLLKCGSDVNAKTKTGVTPLHCAAVKGQREITEMLLHYGGDVSVIMKKGVIDVTPLLWVTENECKKITDIVCRYIARTKTSGFYGKMMKKINSFIGRAESRFSLKSSAKLVRGEEERCAVPIIRER